MKTSEALASYTQTKIQQKAAKYSSKPLAADVSFAVDGHEHVAHCQVSGGDGLNIQVEAASNDMYATVDLLLAKLEAQLKRQKEKLKRHKFQQTLRQLEAEDYVSKDDCDSIPVDAGDLLKYEKARVRSYG